MEPQKFNFGLGFVFLAHDVVYFIQASVNHGLDKKKKHYEPVSVLIIGRCRCCYL